MTVHAAAAGLADELAFLLDRLADRFPVSHLRLADIGGDAELALQSIDDDVEVQLAHARDDRLPRFLVGTHAKRRVFLGQLAERDAHLFLVGNRLRFHRHRNYRIRKIHPFQHDLVVEVAQRIAGADVLEADRGGDIAGTHLFEFFARIGMHLQDAADALALVAGGVVNRVAGVQHPRVNPEKGQVADERVGGDLERQRRERLLVVGMPFAFVFAVGIHAANRWHIERRRQVSHHRVEHRLHTLVLEGAAAQRRYDLVPEGSNPQPRVNVFLAEVALLEVFFHQFVVRLGRGLDHFFAQKLALGTHFIGNLFLVKRRPEVILVPDDFLHSDQVDDAAEALLGAYIHLNRHRVCAQPLADLLDHAREIGAGAVHLVDEHQARHVVALRLPPDGFRLRLDAADRIEHNAGTVEHAQRALHFDGEIYVTRRIDDIDAMMAQLLVHAIPEAGRRRRGDGDAALLLLFHPVHHRGAIVDLADLVGNAGIEQDAFGGGGLAGIDVRDDADISVLRNRCRARHLRIPWSVNYALPAEVSERLVSLGHAMRVFTLLDCGSLVFRCIQQLAGQLAGHGFLTALLRRVDNPAHRQRVTPRSTHLDRHLVGRAADATGFDLDHRAHVFECFFHQLDRVQLALLGHIVECVIHDPLGSGFLAVAHDHVDELGDLQVTELRIRQNFAFRDFSTSGH